jgi:hypothetical protein
MKPRDLFISGRSDGDMRVYLSEDEGAEIQQEVEFLLPSLSREKITVPRGMKPNYFKIALENVAGADFDLDSLQLFGEKLSRRRK